MSETITTKFSVGDKCYYIIHPTADILPCIVDYVRVIPTSTVPTITYRLHRLDKVQIIDYVAENEIDDFATSKTALLLWLNGQITKVTNMTEPA